MKHTLLMLILGLISYTGMAQKKDSSAKELTRSGEAAEQLIRTEMQKQQLNNEPLSLDGTKAVQKKRSATADGDKRKAYPKRCGKKKH